MPEVSTETKAVRPSKENKSNPSSDSKQDGKDVKRKKTAPFTKLKHPPLENNCAVS